jgi:hypothetical protein
VRYDDPQVLRIRNAWLSEATQSQPSLIRCSPPVDKRSSENTPAQRSAGHPERVRSVSVTKPNKKESSVGEGYE